MSVLQEENRPRTWDQLIGLEHKSNGEDTDKSILKYLAETGFARSLIFMGPAGTGKTSASRLFAATYFKISTDEVLDYPYYKEYNAAGDRGIDVIRGPVQTFADIPTPDGTCRILMFDEAEGLTPDAKQALKKIVEGYAYNCIFIFCTNNAEKLKGPIFSRSKQFRFDPIPEDQYTEWFIKMCDRYDIEIASNIPKQVYSVYRGDMRQVISDFIIPNQGKKVTLWKPIETHADEIFAASNPQEKYIEIASKEYLEPHRLLEDLFILNGKKDPVTFLKADLMIRAGGSPMIGVCAALTAIKK